MIILRFIKHLIVFIFLLGIIVAIAIWILGVNGVFKTSFPQLHCWFNHAEMTIYDSPSSGMVRKIHTQENCSCDTSYYYVLPTPAFPGSERERDMIEAVKKHNKKIEQNIIFTP